MPKFRKKPVVIEARQLTDANGEELAAWCSGDLMRRAYYGVAVPTLEGNMIASEGDWIIRGIKGEFYPCKPDIFAATYEEVTDGD